MSTTRDDDAEHAVPGAAAQIQEGQQQQKQPGVEEEDFDYREQDLDKHYLAGLSCERFGGPSDEDAAEMIFWEDIPYDSLHISPFQDPNRKQYLTFEADHGAYRKSVGNLVSQLVDFSTNMPAYCTLHVTHPPTHSLLIYLA